MRTKQPVWKFVANLGDANPIEYGGFAVFVDETGVYPPEGELLIPPEESGRSDWEVRRFICEPCTVNVAGFVSDNSFHPHKPAWFGSVECLQRMADVIGVERGQLAAKFMAQDPCERAEAWRTVGEYFGWDNLDAYPNYFTEEEIRHRWASYV